MIYRVLGELTVSRNGTVIPLSGRANRGVLAALLLNANKSVSKDDLLRSGWGDTEVNEAQLHKAISAIRKLLHSVDRPRALRTHARVGYELRVADEDLDLLLFNRLVRQAGEATTLPAREIGLLRAALALWQGPRPLTNFDEGAFLGDAKPLIQRRKRAAVRLFELEFARRNYGDILEDLATITSYHPTDKRLTELVMIAQYRGGHSIAALAAFNRHAAALRRLLAQPEANPQRLRDAIQAGDDHTIDRYEAVLRAPGGRPGRASQRVPHELPPAPSDFVGRRDLVEEATWLLTRPFDYTGPIVLFTGSAGVGKTTLALQVAHLTRAHFPDGQLFGELHDAAGRMVGSHELLAQFLRSFDVSTIPEARAERAALLRTLLADRRVLLLLDDARDEAQVRDLIPGSATCGVIVTARQRMPDLSGAHHVAPLEPLESTVARDLFERVIVRAGLNPPTDHAATERIVSLCAGLPLAICIAAALQVREYGRPTAELADRLAHRGPEAFEYNERSVARSIGATFDRLDDDARRLFLGLGLTRLPHFGLWTAAAILPGSDADPAGALSQLIASSVITPAGPADRFRFHDLTREYAFRRARQEYASGDEVPTMVYRALLTMVRRAHRGLYDGDFEVVHGNTPDWAAPPAAIADVDASPTDWYEVERANIRSAVSHCAELGLTEECWDLAVSAHEFYNISGYFDDWYDTHVTALNACQAAGDRRGEGVLLAILGQPALVASRRAGRMSGPVELERAVELLTDCGDQHGLAIALRTLANALRRRGYLARPLRLFLDAQRHYEASGDALGSWQARRFIGQTHLDCGRFDEALRELAEAHRSAAALGQPRLVAQTAYWTGQTNLAIGELDRAQADFGLLLDALPPVEGIGHAYAFHGYGDLARRRGDLSAAERHLLRAAALAQTAEDVVLEGLVLLSLAEVYETHGLREEQVGTLRDAIDRFTGADSPYFQLSALAALSRAEAGRGNAQAAHRAWARVEALYAEMDLPPEDRIHRPPPLPTQMA